jgi:hypothetical protein
MSTVSDPELLTFSAELLERHGGAIEPGDDRLLALLPAHLARELELPEEVRLGSEQAPLLYGSPVLDRLIGFATRDVPVVYGQIQVDYLKKAGFEQLIGQDVAFADGLARIVSRAEARATYMALVCRYVALSDERKEGLVQVGIHEGSGALISGLVELIEESRPQFFPSGKVPPHFPVHLEQAVSSGMRSARELVEANLSDFFASMRRRLQRDVKNTREYYAALKTEMKESLSHPNLTEPQRQDRLTKIEELPREMARKIEDLEQKYQVRVTVSACGALRLLVDVVQLQVDLKYRKLQRSIRMTWNPITRRLDPLACERCHATIDRVQPAAAKDSTIRLLCFSCSQKKGP